MKNNTSNTNSDTTTESTSFDTISSTLYTGTTKINLYTSWKNTNCNFGYIFNGTNCEGDCSFNKILRISI